MKKIISRLLALVILVNLFTVIPVFADTIVAEEYAGGAGTPENPYQIANEKQLKHAQEQINAGKANGASFILTADINYNDNEWTPMGKDGATFSGTFDGDGHKVSNLKITTVTPHVGFFGYTTGDAKVTDLGIEDIDIEITRGSATLYTIGGMVGNAAGTFERCYVKGTEDTPMTFRVTNVGQGSSYGTGGFASYVWGKATFKDCYTYNIQIRDAQSSLQGGFFAQTDKTATADIVFENCYAAEVSLLDNTDEINDPLVYAFGCSSLTDNLTIDDCYSTGADKFIRYRHASTGTSGRSYNGITINSVEDMAQFSKATKKSATIDDIKNALVTDNQVTWAVDTSTQNPINGGYPYLTFDPTASTPYKVGDGSVGNPYQISNAGHLRYAQEQINAGNANTKSFKLMTDIDFLDNEWTPIGTADKKFSGTFDGNGHKVSNLQITQFKTDVGFFGYTTAAAEIHDLGIENIDIAIPVNTKNRPETLGGMVGNAAGTFERCYVKGVGETMTLKTSTPAFSVKKGIGGFASYISDAATFKNCYTYNIAMRDAQDKLQGGFFGQTKPGITANIVFENCYAAEISMAPYGSYAAGYREPLVYAFGCSDLGDNLRVVNCYSTWKDQFTKYEYAAAGTSGRSYNGTTINSVDDMAQFSKATKKSATIADIAGAFKNIDVFGADVTINNGYPALKYENPTLLGPMPTPTPRPTYVPFAIKDMPGAIKYFEQNFDDETISENQRVTSEMGFYNVVDTPGAKNAHYYVVGDEITNVSETSNRVMRVVPKIVQARATEEQYAALQASENSVKWGNNTYKVIDFIDGYYIASMCTTRNTSLYWIKKSSVVNGVLTSTVSDTDYGTTFYTDQNGTLTNISKGIDGTYITFNEPAGAGKYAIQFDYAYPDNGNMRTGQEGFNLKIDNGEYHIREYGIHRGYNYTKRYLDFGDNAQSLESVAKNTWIPKETADPDIPHYFLSTDNYASQLTELSTRVDKTWYTVMVYVDIDNKYYTIYFDGYPLYFKAENGGYSCRMKFSEDKLDKIVLYTNRLCIFNDHAPVFDNFVGYYSTGSDEATVERVLEDIKVPYIDAPVMATDILFDVDESKLVTWSFDKDTYIIDKDNPLIARYNAPFGNGTSKVTLRATYTYGTATGTKDFELIVKDRKKYEVDTVLIKDSNGNRVYRPVDNSVIESVSYTANSTETAKMYLAIYDVDKRLVTCKTAIAEDGKCTFNQAINANQTYKVFLWENGTVTPLATPEDGVYPESETPKIFVIGDSIAQTYTTTAKDIKGFGQYLDTAFNGVLIDNTQAVGGRTTKYALAEDRLKYVLDNSVAGDYLFIMLGHNDEKYNTDYYGATIKEYKIIFNQMIDSAKAKGVTPVILTSLARPQYPGGVLVDSHDGYRQALFAIAEATGTPLIDVDTISRNVLKQYTSATYETLGYFVPGDTHTTEKGAKWVVSIIADELKKMNLPISEYLK